MNNKIKVAAYARVSTDMTDQLHSLSAQIKYFALSQQIIDFLTIIKSQPTTHPHYQGHIC